MSDTHFVYIKPMIEKLIRPDNEGESRKEDYSEAAKPLLACWLECAASAVLGLPPSPDRRIWLILDELADLPAVQNLARLLPEGRKFGAARWLACRAHRLEGRPSCQVR